VVPFTSHFIDLAVREAQKSTHLMRLGCVIFKGKSVIATGYNRAHTHTKDIPMKYLKWRGSLHAEMSAVFRALERKKSLQNASLLIVRINNQNQFRFARPCVYCTSGISELTPIRKVFYSINEYPYLIQTDIKTLCQEAIHESE